MTDKEVLIGIGDQLRVLRLKNSLTQKEVALRCDIDVANYQRIERGRVNTTLLMLLKVLRSMDATYSDVFTLFDDKYVHRDETGDF